MPCLGSCSSICYERHSMSRGGNVELCHGGLRSGISALAALVRHAMSWIGLIVLIRKDIACLVVGIANYVVMDLDLVA